MKEYTIICDMYFPNGGSFKYATNPKSEIKKFTYDRTERHLFIEKWEHVLNNDMYYDNIKVYVIDFEHEKVINITNQFNEIKTSI